MKTIDTTSQTNGQLLRIVKNLGAQEGKINEIVRLPEVDARLALESLAKDMMGKKRAS